MDALSNVLKSVRLEGALFLNAEFTAPWCVWSRLGLTNVNERLPGAEDVMLFHFVAGGSGCKLRLAEGGDTLAVEAGDLVLFPDNARHLMGSDLHLQPVETATLMPAQAADEDVFRIRHGGGGAATQFVCGYLAYNRTVCRPLLDALPRVVRVPMDDGPIAAMVRALFRAGARETSAPRPGADSMLARLAELMFVEALRRYVEGLPPGRTGWLAGVRDPFVGRALALLHGDPARAWTVEGLAREVALSRSALAERFTALVGEPPIQYLLRWRLALAAQALRSGSEAISRVAERSGYESEAAFGRAFKREFGLPPAAWRKAGAP